MRAKSRETPRGQDGISFAHPCIVCGRRVVFGPSKSDPILMPGDGSEILAICEDCKEKYLSIGVALVNPETESIIILMDEAFKAIFHEPIPEQRIIYAEEEVLERIQAAFTIALQQGSRIVNGEQVLLN